MTDRTVLVTGGAAGIGGAVSRAFLEIGDRVLVVDRDAASAAALNYDFGNRVQVLVGDVREDGLLERAVRAAVDWGGRLDVAVNNAGIAGPHRPLPEFSIEEYQLIMDVNVRGIFSAMRYEVPVMLGTGRGSVINMASAIGLVHATRLFIRRASTRW